MEGSGSWPPGSPRGAAAWIKILEAQACRIEPRGHTHRRSHQPSLSFINSHWSMHALERSSLEAIQCCRPMPAEVGSWKLEVESWNHQDNWTRTSPSPRLQDPSHNHDRDRSSAISNGRWPDSCVRHAVLRSVSGTWQVVVAGCRRPPAGSPSLSFHIQSSCSDVQTFRRSDHHRWALTVDQTFASCMPRGPQVQITMPTGLSQAGRTGH